MSTEKTIMTNRKLINGFKFLGALTVFLFVMGLFSCSKTTDERSESIENDSKAEVETVKEEDFAETNEDLLTVDYKEFYDELAPHGEWIEVTDKDLGMDMKGTASGLDGNMYGSVSPVRKHAKMSFWELFGTKEAHADDASFGAFFVWKPSPNLAIGVTATETNEPYYQPYTNGQWMHTDAGWYFRAATPHEEVTHHYGRWVHSPSAGWVWVPGRVWAPAWVDWREENDYIAWAPVPPSVYLVNNVVVVPPPVVYEERYVVVEKRYFVEPYVYNHVYWYNKHPHKFKVKHWRRLDGVMVVNNTIIDQGPDVVIMRNYVGREITTVRVNRVTNIGGIQYVDNEVYTYRPDFKKIKDNGKRNRTFTRPEKFNTFTGASQQEKVRRDEWAKKEDKRIQLSNDNDMYKGRNENNDKSRGNDKNAGNNWNKNDNKSKGNDNVKQKGNNKGNNDNRGNDNVKQKGNDRKNNNDGVKQKGNDKSNNKGNDNKGKDKRNDTKKFSNKNDGSKNSGNVKGNDNTRKNKDNGSVKQKGNDRKNDNSRNDSKKEKSNDKGNKKSKR